MQPVARVRVASSLVVEVPCSRASRVVALAPRWFGRRNVSPLLGTFVVASLVFAGEAQAEDCPGLEATLAGNADCRGDSFKVRAVAAVALGSATGAAGENALERALQADSHYAVRAAAASALGRRANPEAIGPLLRALSDDEPLVQEQAARALTRFHAAEHLLAFRDSLASNRVRRRRAAVDAYAAQLKEGAAGASVPVVNALGDEDAGIRDAARAAIESVPLVKAVTFLLNGLENGDEEVRNASAHSLGARPDPMAVDALIDARTRLGQSAATRKALGPALKAHREWLDVERLRDQAKVQEVAAQSERMRALDVLAGIEDETATRLLKVALRSPSGATRATSGRLLAELGGSDAKSALAAAVGKEKDARVKRQLELAARRAR